MKQNPSIPSKVRTEHLERESLVYVRQSTMAQVRFNQESTQRQYALRERALSLGWPEEHIRIIDGDLGISGSGRSRRPGFAQLVTSVSLGEVGAVFGLEISRLARSSADLMKLLELCSRARISNSFAVSSTTCPSTRTNRCSMQKYKSPI